MKFKTFYKLFYAHRVKKAKNLLKIYLFIILPFKYLYNLPFVPSKINLDKLEKKKSDLLDKDLNYLFDYFNSDKGNFYENQYAQPSKRKREKIKAHGYGKFYESYFANFSLGAGYHDGYKVTSLLDRKSLGCKLLFRESLDIGYRFHYSHSIMAHLDHISNAKLCSNNEGLESVGIRYGYHF